MDDRVNTVRDFRNRVITSIITWCLLPKFQSLVPNDQWRTSQWHIGQPLGKLQKKNAFIWCKQRCSDISVFISLTSDLYPTTNIFPSQTIFMRGFIRQVLSGRNSH